jgi:Lon protease-like protein
MDDPAGTHFLRLFPLESLVLFPGMDLPLIVFEPRYLQLTQECVDSGEPFGVLLLRSGREVGDAESQSHQVGTTAHIQRVSESNDGRLRVTAVGRDRFRVVSFIYDRPYLSAHVEYLPDDQDRQVPNDLLQRVKEVSTQYVQALLALRGGYMREVALPDSPEALSYTVAMLLQGQQDTQQHLLEVDNTANRLTQESELLRTALEEVKERMKQRWSDRGFHRN